jgi:hypothetical protein
MLTGGDASYFVVAGPPATDPRYSPSNLHVFPSGTTYDGQYFYRLALEPWTSARTAAGITFDGPAYRQQRIFYPLMAWLLSAGQWQLTPVALIVTNILAAGGLGYTAGRFAQHAGRSPFAGLLLTLYPGYIATISRDLAELCEAALLCAGVLLVARARYRWAAAALIAAALAKEAALAVPLAGLAAWSIRRVRGQMTTRVPVSVWLVPVLVFAAWYTFINLRWGFSEVIQGDVNFAWPPLSGALQGRQSLMRLLPDWRVDGGVLGLVGLVATAAIMRPRAVRPGIAEVLALAVLVYLGLAIMYSQLIWRDEYAFPRALHELFLTASLALLASHATWTRWITRLASVGALALSMQLVLERAASP